MKRRGIAVLLAVLTVLALASVTHADGPGTITMTCNIVWCGTP
jgi:hypothetical protein